MRTVRKECESEIYHVISRGTGRQLIFEDDADRKMFLDLLETCTRDNMVGILAWCLMGNHIHLLLHASMSNISLCMRGLCGRYAQYFNMRHERTGHLFQSRFRSEPVDNEAYLIAVAGYIHYNPEKAHVASQEAYYWSSFGEYVGREGARRLCRTGMLLDLLGGTGGFVQYHREHAAESSCMDVDNARSTTRSMPDEKAMGIAKTTLGETRLDELKALDRPIRNQMLGKLLAAGLSVRQLERLTGISRGIIQAAAKRKT